MTFEVVEMAKLEPEGGDILMNRRELAASLRAQAVKIMQDRFDAYAIKRWGFVPCIEPIEADK